MGFPYRPQEVLGLVPDTRPPPPAPAAFPTAGTALAGMSGTLAKAGAAVAVLAAVAVTVLRRPQVAVLLRALLWRARMASPRYHKLSSTV